MTTRITKMDDEDSFWNYLNGQGSTSSKKNEETDDKKDISKFKENEANTTETTIFEKNTEPSTPKGSQTNPKSSKDELLNILNKIDDLNKLDNIDDSDEELFNEEEEDSEFDDLDDKKNITNDAPDKQYKQDVIGVEDKEEDPLKGMSIWKKIINSDFVTGKLDRACDVLGLGVVIVSIATLYQAVKTYFRMKSMIL